MKPDELQQKILQQYLRENLDYRETYAEFYDHILSAIEAKPADMTFKDAMTTIIREDFDGIGGMRMIEKRYQRAIFKEMQRKYLNFIIDCLKFPLIGILAVYVVSAYVLVRQPWFNLLVFGVLVFILRSIPAMLKGTRYVASGYVLRDTKRSVKDSVFVWLDLVPGVIFLLLMACSPAIYTGSHSPVVWFSSLNPLIITGFLMVCGLHDLAFYKIYRYDLKTSIVL